MAKCDSSTFVINSDATGKLSTNDIIYISVLDNLSSCAKIDTKNMVTGNGANITNLTNPYYNAANVPEDMLGCSKNKCYNSGSFQGKVTTAATDVVIGNLLKEVDATLYVGGLISAYIFLEDSGEHGVKLDIAEYTSPDWQNYDSITVNVHANKGAGWYPVIFDLASTSQAQTGNGWHPDQVGVKLRFTIKGTNLKANSLIGVSSIAFYEGIEDLELNKTIILNCLETWGDNQNFDVIESACAASEYDKNSGNATFSLTAAKATPELRYLNPTLSISNEMEAGIPRIVSRKVLDAKTYFTGRNAAIADELDGFGVVQLSDIFANDCGFMYVQTPGCAGNSHSLTRVSSPTPTISQIDADKYQVLTNDYAGILSQGLVLVAGDWIGQELNFIYRKKVTAKVWNVTNEFRERRVNIIAPKTYKDGRKEYHLYENVMLTAMPDGISRTSDTNIELQFTVATDENGLRKKIIEPTDM